MSIGLPKKTTRILLIVSVSVLVVVVGLSMCTSSVPTGYTGIMTTFGKVENYTLEAGLHFKSPFQRIIIMDNRTQKLSFNLSAFSADIQEVSVQGSINFNIDKTTAVTLYREVGTNYVNILLMPRVLEETKGVFTKYSADKLVENRELLSGLAKKGIMSTLPEYGINIISLAIEDIDFKDEFTTAVEAKQVAEQEKLKVITQEAQKTAQQQAAADRQVIQAKADSEKRIIDAEAEAKEKVIAAEAEAKRIEATATAEANATKQKGSAEADIIFLKAKAQAEGNELLAKYLNENVIEYQKYLSWGGGVPGDLTVINGMESSLPMLNLN